MLVCPTIADCGGFVPPLQPFRYACLKVKVSRRRWPIQEANHPWHRCWPQVWSPSLDELMRATVSAALRATRAQLYKLVLGGVRNM